MRFRENALGLLVPCEPRCYFDVSPRAGGLVHGVNLGAGGGSLPAWLSQFGGGGGGPTPSSPVAEYLKSGYRESDATTPEDSEEVVDWINSGTNGSDLTQAGASPAPPIHHTDVGGLGTSGLLADGTLWMYNTSFNTTSWGAMTWYCGVDTASPPPNTLTLMQQETSGGVLIARLYVNTSGQICFQYRVAPTTYSAITTATPYTGPQGSFSSIIVTRDASDGQIAIWFNNVKQTLGTDTKGTGTTSGSGQRVSIFSDATGSASNAWIGFMTECGMYDRKLTDAQVGSLHTALALGF